MVRRIFAGLAVIGLLLAATNSTAPVSSSLVKPALGVYFFLLLFVQIFPLVMTVRGYFGKARHPVNKMYASFSLLGIVGTLGVVAVVFLSKVEGSLDLIIILAGPMMFLGIVASAVLAFFATPWRDWTYSEAAAEEQQRGRFAAVRRARQSQKTQ